MNFFGNAGSLRAWEKIVRRFFLIAGYGVWTLRGMKQERIFWLKAEMFVRSVEFLD